MVVWKVDPGSSEPLFQQIVNRVKQAVALGRLNPGDRLPSVRELAKELVINPNTIARAFRELESEGVTLSRRGSGTFVAERKVVLKAEERRRRLREALEAALRDAVHLGLDGDEVRKVFEAALTKYRFGGEEGR
jgi:GntR family transcriptional regulator